jgi:hypothetical protein
VRAQALACARALTHPRALMNGRDNAHAQSSHRSEKNLTDFLDALPMSF